VPVERELGVTRTNIPIDAVVMPRGSELGKLPLLIEAKSAGDYANTNKRRKEEATKFRQLTSTYGDDVRFVLFLCGYFDAGYLGYEAAEGIDWVWEHRMDDLAKFGI
jgi:type II restriction enzyme